MGAAPGRSVHQPSLTYLSACLAACLPAFSWVFYLFICQSIFPSVFSSITCLSVCQSCPQPSLPRPPSRRIQTCLQPRGPFPSSRSRDNPARVPELALAPPAGHREAETLANLVAKLLSSLTTVVGAQSPLLSSLGKCFLST